MSRLYFFGGYRLSKGVRASSSSRSNMPVTDADVGITEFLGSHHPFRAVVKQTVDDFVVNEILLSGDVARITQLARPAASRQSSQVPTQNTESFNIDNVPFHSLDALFTASTAPSVLIRDALVANQTSVTLPPCSDKQVRTQIHAWVRENLPAYVTDTIDSAGQSAVRLRRKDLCRPWKRRRLSPPNTSKKSDAIDDQTYDPREGKDKSNRTLRVGPKTYVQFILWKRNRDTTEALSILGKILGVPANAFTYAGTKDKRAVTTQLVQVRGISEARFAHANRIIQRKDKGFRSMVIGNVEPAPRRAYRPLGLGDLRGNRFTLALRDLQADQVGEFENVIAGVESLRMRGFVNYFGLQRFGSGVSPTHETGFAALRGDFEDVCRRILLPLKVEDEKEGMRPERKRFVLAMERFAKREMTARELEEQLPQRMFIERTIVGSFVHDEMRGIANYDFKKAFGSLPRNLKKMYGHAVQSFLWNVMASERVRRSTPNSPDRMFAIEGDIIPRSDKWIRDFSYETNVRSVTKEEEKNKSISIFRVLLPVIGSEVGLPDVEYSCVAKRILEEQGIDLKGKLSAEFGMKGTYRPLITKPREVEAKVVTYADRNVKLIHSDAEQSCQHENLESNDGQQTCPTKEQIKPGVCDESALGSGKQNTVELNSTTNNASSCERKAADSKKSAVSHFAQGNEKNCRFASEEERHDLVATNKQIVKETPHLSISPTVQRSESDRHALILSFTLGCAEYATMLVRELTRQESSTANQKALQNGVPIASSAVHQPEIG